MSNHYKKSLAKLIRSINQNRIKIESEKKFQRIIKRTKSISGKKKQSTNQMTLFKSLNLLKKKKRKSFNFIFFVNQHFNYL